MNRLFFAGLAVGFALVPTSVSAQASTQRRVSRTAEPVRKVVERMAEESHILVLADSTVAGLTVPPLDTAATPETVEEQLGRIARRLPPGTVVHKLYLPKPAEGKRYSADAVAQLAKAQVALYGRPSPKMVFIQGKSLTPSEAEPLIQSLGLQVVFVLTGPSSGSLAATTSGLPTGITAAGSSPVMDALLKQLGVSNPRDIPSGTYKVQIPTESGGVQDATVEVENGDGKMRIGIRIGNDKP